MKFAIHIHLIGIYADPKLASEIAKVAEEAGWDGAFVNDHVVHGEPIASPWIAMTAMACATSRIAIGPMVTPLPRRRPWQVAGEAATLDQLSVGRLILGVGSGIGDEFTPLSEEHDPPTRGAMLDESLAIVERLWRGDPVTFEGQHYRVENVAARSRPLQRPRIPIWVAGHWPHKRPFRRAAAWDGVFIDGPDVDWMKGEIISPADLRASAGYTLQHRNENGPFDVVIGGHTPPARWRTIGSLAPYAEAGATWWVEAVYGAFGDPDEMKKRIAQGPPSV